MPKTRNTVTTKHEKKARREDLKLAIAALEKKLKKLNEAPPNPKSKEKKDRS